MNARSDQPERHPRLASVLQRNIRNILAQRDRVAARRSLQEKIADAITDFSGHMVFVYFHVAWFAVWIAWNLGAFGGRPFDPFPFGLLTEHEVTRALTMLDEIQEKLGCAKDAGTDLDELEAEVRPEDVLEELERQQHRVTG